MTVVSPTAARFRFTEHAKLWLLVSDPLGQTTLISAGIVDRVRFVDCVPPFKLAVIVADSSADTAFTFAVN
jgi:hypothetical protein